MTIADDTILTYEIREVLAAFHDAARFESAVERLEEKGISPDAIRMMASQDAVHQLPGPVFTAEPEGCCGQSLSRAIYADKHDIGGEQALAVGVPVYLGGAGAGLAMLASGGTLASVALIGAAGAVAGAGIGMLFARAIGRHHAAMLARQLASGALMVTVAVSDPDEEQQVTAILTREGGEPVEARSLTRYAVFDAKPPHYSGRRGFSRRSFRS